MSKLYNWDLKKKKKWRQNGVEGMHNPGQGVSKIYEKYKATDSRISYTQTG